MTISTGGSTSSVSWDLQCYIEYNGVRKITFRIQQFFTRFGVTANELKIRSNSFSGDNAVTADSTMSATGNPLYLDCEIGEAYKMVNGQIVLVNKNVEIPSDLPVLSPGANTITMDNTFTKANVIPRWWII